MRYFIFFFDGYSSNNRHVGSFELSGECLPSTKIVISKIKSDSLKRDDADIWITGFNEVTKEDFYSWAS